MKNNAVEQFSLKGKDAEAIGVLTEDGFTVKAGAVARKEIVPSATDTVTPVRERLLAEGVLESHDGQLQDEMDELAPDVSRLAWGHKYFSLLYPEKLDDYHSAEFQRFHILKLLQLPPEGDGRYICAGRFVAAAREVSIPMNQFTGTLNAVHGGLHRYWQVGTRAKRDGKSHWEMMRDRNCIAIGWSKLGDLSWVEKKRETRKKLRKLGFVEMMPDGTVLRDSKVGGIPLRAWFDALNERIRQHVGLVRHECLLPGPSIPVPAGESPGLLRHRRARPEGDDAVQPKFQSAKEGPHTTAGRCGPSQQQDLLHSRRQVSRHLGKGPASAHALPAGRLRREPSRPASQHDSVSDVPPRRQRGPDRRNRPSLRGALDTAAKLWDEF